MDTLLDYIQWMGDFPIEATGFREMDAVVLCVIGYYDLAPIFSREGEVHTVRDCLRMLEEGQARILITGKDMGYDRILSLAASSRRYGELKMTDYVDLVRSEPPLQFSALCFHDGGRDSFLVYRGTDNTLVGWEEDFMISFQRTEAQGLALSYAQGHLHRDRNWFMMGHSKGGNLALYTACLLDDDTLEALEHIYLLDAPGLCPEVVDPSRLERIDPRVTRMMPQFSIIGKLFEAKFSDTRIVHSSASGLMQHSLASWCVDHGRPAPEEEFSPRSLWLNGVFNAWLADMSPEERSAMTHDLFDALAAGGAQTLNELENLGPEGLEPILRSLANASDAAKRALAALPYRMMQMGLQIPLFLRREAREEAKEEQPV